MTQRRVEPGQILAVQRAMFKRRLRKVSAADALSSGRPEPTDVRPSGPADGCRADTSQKSSAEDEVLRWQLFCTQLTEATRLGGLQGDMANYKAQLMAEMKRRA